jgi:hypothetical protein
MESAAPSPFLEVPDTSLWSARTASLMIRAFVGVMAASPSRHDSAWPDVGSRETRDPGEIGL